MEASPALGQDKVREILEDDLSKCLGTAWDTACNYLSWRRYIQAWKSVQ